MVGFTRGVYLVNDSSTAPSSGYTLGTEGWADSGGSYIKLSSEVRLDHSMSFSTGAVDLPGGVSYAANLGTFGETMSINDKARTADAYDAILRFCKESMKSLSSFYTYLVVVTADTPTLMNFYQNTDDAVPYLPGVISDLRGTYDEKKGFWTVQIVYKAVWDA